MRKLRIILASVMLIASVLWLVLGAEVAHFAKISESFQIIPSAIHTCLGTTVFWIIATLLFGRVYCSTVCPVGTLQDAVVWIRRKSKTGKNFRFRESRQLRYVVLFAYLVSLVLGTVVVGFIIEPWNMMRNVASTVNPADTVMTWQSVGVSVGVGIAAGAIAIVAVLVWAWHSGRDFCNDVCPIGTMLGCVHQQALFHIAIDPDKCVSCMKCEDVCSSQCIKVANRFVDNSRCVKCFDCIDVCPNDAIRYQLNRERNRQTPLLTPS